MTFSYFSKRGRAGPGGLAGAWCLQGAGRVAAAEKPQRDARPRAAHVPRGPRETEAGSP